MSTWPRIAVTGRIHTTREHVIAQISVQRALLPTRRRQVMREIERLRNLERRTFSSGSRQPQPTALTSAGKGRGTRRVQEHPNPGAKALLELAVRLSANRMLSTPRSLKGHCEVGRDG